MKKLFLIFILAALTVVSMATAQTKNGAIRTGYTMLSKPMAFTAADSLAGNGGHHLVTSDSLVILVSNAQKYFQHVTFTTTLANHSGATAVTITARGKVTATDSWHPIGSAGSWTGTEAIAITSTVPANYNYYRISYVCSGATQNNTVTAFEVKTSNILEVPTSAGTVTFSRQDAGTVTLQTADNNADAAAVYRAGGSGALTLGASTGTTSITSSDWAIGATGIATGLGAITSNGLITTTLGATITGATTSINASSNFGTNINTGTSNGALALGGGSGTVAVSGTGWGVTTAGVRSGMTYTNAPTVIWSAGGSTVLATSGTDVACSNGARWWVELNIPDEVSLTGIAFLVGSVGGTDSVVVQLHNSAGVEVATSKKTGANHGAIVGTAAQFQSCPFYVGASATPYVATEGKYFVSVQFNGTTAKFRAYPIPGSKFITGTAAGTWNTAANITPGTTFTADKGPIIMTY
jgi:hypothetical protein